MNCLIKPFPLRNWENTDYRKHRLKLTYRDATGTNAYLQAFVKAHHSIFRTAGVVLSTNRNRTACNLSVALIGLIYG